MPNTPRSSTPLRWDLATPRGPLTIGPMPAVMGILNTTPDSFSDGGRFLDPAAAVDHALQMIADGAGIIDIGGESTRPGADELPADQEIARTVPVIAALRRQSGVTVSIDTRKAAVARAALDAGADIVNDISALGDPEMPPLVARTGCPVVLMHMQGTPETMQRNPTYRDVVTDVRNHLAAAIDRAESAGIAREQTILDPGIGFGKTLAHNLALLRHTDQLVALGRPVLIGTSRKSFIGRVLDAEPSDRLMGTVASCIWTRALGAAMFRVHDVAEIARALRLAAAIEGSLEIGE